MTFPSVLPDDARLASVVARPLFMRQEYGEIIKHMEAHQIENLAVPLIPDTEIRAIDEMIRRAWLLRDDANKLERDALSRLQALFARRGP